MKCQGGKGLVGEYPRKKIFVTNKQSGYLYFPFAGDERMLEFYPYTSPVRQEIVLTDSYRFTLGHCDQLRGITHAGAAA